MLVSLCLNFGQLLSRKKIYSNEIFHIFHLFQASGKWVSTKTVSPLKNMTFYVWCGRYHEELYFLKCLRLVELDSRQHSSWLYIVLLGVVLLKKHNFQLRFLGVNLYILIIKLLTQCQNHMEQNVVYIQITSKTDS
jgi:hypothetical protein